MKSIWKTILREWEKWSESNKLVKNLVLKLICQQIRKNMEVSSCCVREKFCYLNVCCRATKLNFLTFLFYSFIEIYFVYQYHKIYPFKVYSSVVFSVVTALGNHHQFQNSFVIPKETPYPWAVTPLSLLPSAPGNH